MDALGEVLRVHEDEGLSRLARLEDFFYEIEFLSLLALHPELLDVIQFQLLGLDFDLLCFTDDLALPFLDQFVSSLVLGLVGGREENPLQIRIPF